MNFRRYQSVSSVKEKEAKLIKTKSRKSEIYRNCWDLVLQSLFDQIRVLTTRLAWAGARDGVMRRQEPDYQRLFGANQGQQTIGS